MSGNIHEECGVFGIYCNTPSDVAHSAYFGLYALQHRGQESCGIVVNDRGVFKTHKGLGLVNEVFNERVLSEFGQGRIAVGHVRYSTTGNVNTANCQPMTVRHVKGALAIAHNGNLINALELRRQYELKGAIFHSTSDTEVISYAVTEARLETGSIQEAVEKAMYKIKGAYSLVVMSPKKLIAARDPQGFRPLCMGRLPDGAGYVFASESCALDSIGAEFVRDVEPGEIVVADENGIQTCLNSYISHVPIRSLREQAYIVQGFAPGITLRLSTPFRLTLLSAVRTADLTLRSGSLSRAVSPTASASSRTAT